MKDKHFNTELDKIIRASMRVDDEPSEELNNSLKLNLYRQEMNKKAPAVYSLPLWYLPMILNFVIFSLLAVAAQLVIVNPYLSILVTGICLYLGIAGVLLTIVGVKRTRLKEDITIHIQKGSALA